MIVYKLKGGILTNIAHNRVRWDEPQANPNIFKYSPLINNTQLIKSGFIGYDCVISLFAGVRFLPPAHSKPNILKHFGRAGYSTRLKF
jgi:hypothetical protein